MWVTPTAPTSTSSTNDSALFFAKPSVEMLHEQQVDPEPRDLALLDPERGQPERLACRHEDAARMRLEGQHPGGLPRRLGAVARLADQRRVPQMQPIEIAQRQHRAARVGAIRGWDGGRCGARLKFCAKFAKLLGLRGK